MLLKDPGNVANATDGMSCLHACMQMVMRTKPDGPIYSFEQMDHILRRKPGLYSWGYAISEAISQQGFKVQAISTFSTSRFIEEKEAYLLERFGPDAGRVQIDNIDLPIVLEDAKKFLGSHNVEVFERVPDLNDIRTLLSEGWYLVTLINSHKLNSQTGYSGHFIFIYGYDEECVIFHDPGLPAQASRHVSWHLFENAWSSPTLVARSLSAFRAK